MQELVHDPVFRVFAVCAAILVFKMALTGSITGMLRLRTGAYITPEDYKFMGREPTPPDDRVERYRRVHQNDLENIPPFLILAHLYMLSGPSYGVAATLFIAFTAARIVHTVTYLGSIQPWRSIAFEVGQIALVVTAILLVINVCTG
jgi:uncharacterized MAPEG superfamily protein